MGYKWVSSRYPAHAIADTSGKRPDEKVMSGIIAAQQQAQPYIYQSGLVEVPMSPISDVTAFRTGRWPLEAFLDAIRIGVAWAIEHRSCLLLFGASFLPGRGTESRSSFVRRRRFAAKSAPRTNLKRLLDNNAVTGPEILRK